MEPDRHPVSVRGHAGLDPADPGAPAADHRSLAEGIRLGAADERISHYSLLSGRGSGWAGGQLDLVSAGGQDPFGRVRCLPGRARQGQRGTGQARAYYTGPVTRYGCAAKDVNAS
jgi:hypothetical protein